MSSTEETGRASATLAQPLELACGQIVRNRLVKAAMSEQLGRLDGAPTPELERLYERWARGGCGLQISGNVMVDRRSIGEPRNVVVEDERDVEALRRLARSASLEGTMALVQLNHPGRQTPTGTSELVVAPSAIPISYRGAFPKPRALTSAEIEEIIARFAQAARICVEAGFAGVQIHGAHGYLVSQFLSPRANQRDDEWGGDAQRRRRFLLEIVRAIRTEIGASNVLAVKLNSADFQRGFAEDDCLDVVAMLDGEEVDLLEISGGTYESPAMTGVRASTAAREAYFIGFAERVREVAKLPLMVTGGFRSGTAMAEAIVAGATDLIGLARPLALEPELAHALLRDADATRSAYELHSIGIRALDAAADLYWTQHQVRRLGQGREPDPRYGARRAALDALLANGINSLRRRRAG